MHCFNFFHLFIQIQRKKMMHHFNKTVGLASTVMTMTLGSGQEEQMHLSSTGQKGMMQLQTKNVLYSVKLAGLKTTV